MKHRLEAIFAPSSGSVTTEFRAERDVLRLAARGSELQLLHQREALPRARTNYMELQYRAWRGVPEAQRGRLSGRVRCVAHLGPRPSGAT